MVFCWLDDKRSVQCRDNQIEKCSSKLMELFLELWSIARYLEHKNAEKQQLVNYFASSDPHHDISKQLVDTTFVWSFCHGTFAQLTMSCSLPDLNHDHPRPVFPAGPQPRPSPPSVPCRTSTTTIHAQCSLSDLNHDHPRPVEVRQGTLGGDGRGWGPAGNTGRGWSWLRSDREHCAWMVVVEVRQGTLGGDGRGWGPAGSRRRGDEERRRGEERREERRGGEGGREEGGEGGGRGRGGSNWHKI